MEYPPGIPSAELNTKTISTQRRTRLGIPQGRTAIFFWAHMTLHMCCERCHIKIEDNSFEETEDFDMMKQLPRALELQKKFDKDHEECERDWDVIVWNPRNTGYSMIIKEDLVNNVFQVVLHCTEKTCGFHREFTVNSIEKVFELRNRIKMEYPLHNHESSLY